MLLDPLKVEYADVEISTEPAAKPLHKPAEGPEPQQMQRIWNQIPAVPLFWLRTWIFWLADMMARFFLVFA